MQITDRNIAFAIIALLLIIVIGYIIYNQPGSNYFPMSTVNTSLNYNDYYRTKINPAWDKYCLNSKTDSLVIIMHITKNGDKFNMECEYGPHFNSVISKREILYVQLNDTSTFADSFTGCDANYAKFLHNVIVSSSPLASPATINNMIIPFSHSIDSPESLNDYYVFILSCHSVNTPTHNGVVDFIYDPVKNRVYG